MSRFGLSRASTPRAQTPHAAPHGSPAAGAGRGSVAGSVGEAVGEAAAGAAAGAASRGAGRSALGMLSQFLSSNASSAAFKALLAYAAFKGLMGFKDDVLNGTPFATGGAVPPDRLAAAAAGSNRSSGTSNGQHTPSPNAVAATPAVIDPRVERNMSTVAGRDALAASVRFDGALDGKSEADRLVYADGRYPIPGPERPVLEANSAALGSNDNASFIRMTVPGGGGKTVDFLASHAVNDRAALKEFQEAYPRLARDQGLPADLPPGASVMIGRAPGMGEVFQTSQPREYRFIQDNQFQRNPRFDGTIDEPGSRSFASATGYRDGSRPFDLAEVRQGDTNVVRASRVDEQSRESSLILHEEAYVGSLNDTVKSPVSVMDRMLGRSTGSGFEDLAKAISPSPRETRLLQSVDLGSQQRSVGVVGKEGSAVLGTGPDGDFISLAHRGREGVAMNIQVSVAKGGLGQFEPGGGFAGTDLATTAMGNVRQAMANRLDSPVLSAVKGAGVAGEKDVMLDLTPGKESAVTRIHYGDRIVDYAARDGQMTMIERDPRTNTVREAAMIRSRDIRVDASGHIAMDPASQQVLNDHVKVYASGRSGQDFAQMHPLETTQFVSLRDAPSPSPGTALAAAGRPGVPDVEATGTASAVRAASLRETATPVSVAEIPAQPARRAASVGLGE